MKALRIDTNRLTMLDKTMWNCACSVCDKLQSRWAMRTEEEEPKPICSLCFLYQTKWGQDRKDTLADYLSEISKQQTERKMLISATGELVSPADGDFVVGIVALTSRQFDVEDAAQAQAQAPASK